MSMQLADVLRFYLIPDFGIRKCLSVLEHLSSEEFFHIPVEQARSLGFSEKQIRAITTPNQALIEQLIDWEKSQVNHKIVHYFSSEYPPLLREISSPPLVLFCKGDASLLSHRQLAMVGSRRVSHYGKEMAFEFASQLVHSGFVVTSGLALGIDGESHKGAISAGGKTIAVLGTGVEAVYPKRHIKLAQEVIANGCLISEFLPNTPARAENFPRRNRIISGLSEGTLVVEAAIKSGSLITAKYALEQNREVFAVPGSVHSDYAKGCHHLIKQGAKLTENVDDILHELSAINGFPVAKLSRTASVEESNLPTNEQLGLFCTDNSAENAKSLESSIEKPQKVASNGLASGGLLDTVDYEVTPVDIIAQRSQKAIDEVLTNLLELEMQGEVAAVPGGYIKLRRS